ncbi:putative E3 ubiquitin-protein ligase TRIML1 [Macrotis lagotis]|uniref:putative E3 ubiquitin-protein ligase TRIML1 n=1 Tax=Macrotis lagotis TaxID=92651 RepID=UPI003D68B111
MDTKSLLENFKVDLTCVLCLGYLTDPVVVKCGHNFCKECLLSCWKEVHTPINCPCCSEIIEFGDFLNNKRLQNLTINSRMLGSLLLQSILDLTICDTHRKEEIMFCEKDHRSLCGCCFLSTEHKEHKVLPLEKAALQCMLECQTLKVMLAYEYDKIHQFFLEKKWLQSQRLDTEARDTLNVEENKDNLTQEMIKCSGNSEKHPVEMFKEKKLHLQILDLDIKDNSTKFEECKAKMIQQIHKLQTVMSEIEKNFEKLPIEMLQSFISGKHYWEIEVGNKTEWEVGICKESIRRKGKASEVPGDTHILITSRHENKLQLYCLHHDIHVCQPIHRLGIFLDYERGHIAFYNAPYGTLICSPPNHAFQGPLHPCFSLCSQKSKITSGPLHICPRSKK